MANRIQALSQQFFNKTSEEISIEELRHVAKRHPYFAPVQFILVQKLNTAPAELEKQKAKAVLFYPDPLLFEKFMLADASPANTIEVYKEPGTEEPAAEPVPEEMLAVQEEVIPLPQPIEEAVIEEDPYQQAEIKEGEVETVEQDSDSLELSNTTMTEEVFTSEEKEIIEPQTLASGLAEETLPNVQQQPLEQPASQPENLSAELAFEPFHTVDYFASQGIKISQEEMPKDKLGKGLKSFTEWLRTMKRLPATPIPVPAENTAERKVENMANHSVVETNVVTEAMAEVWAKQGNREKALDIYNKLSLLNPSKKAYFATKIDNLKTF